MKNLSISCLNFRGYGSSLLNFYNVPKNFESWSPSSKSELNSFKKVNIVTKFAIIIENIATPNRRMNPPNVLSRSLCGCKSPNPTVESEVKAKYTTAIVISNGSVSYNFSAIIKFSCNFGSSIYDESSPKLVL